MFVLTHAAVGALIGHVLPQSPLLSFTLAWFIHFLTDVIPHGDNIIYKRYIAGKTSWFTILYVGGDILLTALFSILVLKGTAPSAFTSVTAGIIGGILPDILVGLYEIWRVPILKQFHRAHFFFHNIISGRVGDVPLWAGLGLEFSLIFLFCYRLF